MLQKIKHLFIVLFLASFTLQPALAESFNKDDMAFAFGNSAVSNDLGEMALLSNQEMMETQGNLAPIYIGAIGLRLAYHGAHHTFRLVGKSRHVQLNWWIKGSKPGKGGVFRIPWQWWKK